MKFATVFIGFASLTSTVFGLAQISTQCAGEAPCDTDGAIICAADGASFSVCNHGCAVNMGAVAAGTRCALGSIMAAPTVQSVSEAAGMGNEINVENWDRLLSGEFAAGIEEKLVIIAGKGFELSVGGDDGAAGNVTVPVTGRRMMARRAAKTRTCPFLYINGYGPFNAPGCK
ncbi:hypothetical protein EDC01DRAFT_777581 [Geopyxis carbonaria]|nr:hypothetical protein EDC01DRAFT_777581 [Geopyxis carbonaria]